jgi:hypothetical protein
MMTAALFHSLRHQRAHNRNILDQLLRHTMPLLQILRAIVGNPNLALAIFRHHRFQGLATWKIPFPSMK